MRASRFARRTAVVAAVGIPSLALVAWALLRPPGAPPDYAGPRPEIAEGELIAHTEEVVVAVPLDRYAAWAATASLESHLRGTSRLPAVARTEELSGAWGEPGARRRVVLSDGHQVAEEILANEPPSRFRYEVWGFTNFGRFLTDYAVGEFRISGEGDTTRVRWTYAFHPRSRLAAPLLSRFVDSVWTEFMRTSLETIRREAEASAAPS